MKTFRELFDVPVSTPEADRDPVCASAIQRSYLVAVRSLTDFNVKGPLPIETPAQRERVLVQTAFELGQLYAQAVAMLPAPLLAEASTFGSFADFLAFRQQRLQERDGV